MGMVDKKTLRVLVSRKRDYLIILECVGEGTTMGDLVTCVSEKGLNKSYGTIAHEVMTLSKYGILRVSRLGKYTVVVKNVDIS